MKVFLTGGTGFVGSHVVVALIGRGHEVTVLTRRPPAFPQPGVAYVLGDLADFGDLGGALRGHDACVHNALIWDEEATELELMDTRACVHLFDAAARAGIEQMLYTSSTAVHRPFTAHEGQTMTEEDRLAPDDLYGATKVAGETFLSAFSHQTDMRCNVIRAAPVVGGPAFEGAPVKTPRRIEEIVLSARLADEIHVESGAGRQFISAPNLALLFCAVLESGANREVYLATDREVTTWEDIARMAVSLCGSTRQVLTNPRAPPGIFDVGKIEREFGFVFDSREALREQIVSLCKASPLA
jgi:UDP-glucose 4-epimerase